MFPHNSSSHEISTETNAFVQNSKGDVVVLEESSLTGVRDVGKRPEDAGYCDIEFIKNNKNNNCGRLTESSSNMPNFVMAKQTAAAEPISHTEADAIIDLSTVLMSGADKSSAHVEVKSSLSADGQSIVRIMNTFFNNVDEKTINTLIHSNKPNKTCNHGLAKDNIHDKDYDEIKLNHLIKEQNEKMNNAIHDKHHNNRGHEATVAASNNHHKQQQSAAANSKSTSKPLSDNKDSFSSVSPRVLSLRNKTTAADVFQYYRYLSTMIKDEVKEEDEQRRKINNRRCSAPSLVRMIPKSDDGQRALNLKANISHVSLINKPNNSMSVISLGSSSAFNSSFSGMKISQNTIKKIFNEIDQEGTVNNHKERQASSSITLTVPTTTTTRRACLFLIEQLVQAGKDELERRLISALCVPLNLECKAPMQPLLSLLQLMSYQYMKKQLWQQFMLTSSIDGISYTEATMFTVGAPSSRVYNDYKSNNEPLNTSFKISGDNASYRRITIDNDDYLMQLKEIKMQLSKSMLIVKINTEYDNNKNYDKDYSKDSDKSDEFKEKAVDYDDNNKLCRRFDEKTMIVRQPANNNIPNTCEPTMTLNCQSTTVIKSQAMFDVPAIQSTLENEMNKTKKSDKTGSSLVEDCKSLLADYFRVKRDNDNCDDNVRQLTRLREVLNTLLTTKHRSALIDEIIKNKDTIPIQKYENNNCGSAAMIHDYKQRWGIPSLLGLCGGGESSLNSGATASWASQPTTPTNNNPAPSGWSGSNSVVTSGGNASGSNPQQQQQTPQANWQQGAPGNRSMQGQGPPGNPAPQQVPPTSQSNNQTTGNTAANTNTQWGQQAQQQGNKATNQQSQNNNGSGVAPQQQQPPNQQQPQQAQPLQPQQQAGVNNNQQMPNSVAVSAGSPPATNPSTKQQLEQLNTMREALFSPDGWGCQHVNQDTNWDVPGTPEPAIKSDNPMWKTTVNNGTDLWEANLRNGGQPPPQQAKTPWGHTPSTNIGGTWGEDDDTADTSNMWTGTPSQPPAQPNTGQWPGAGGNTSQTGMWQPGGSSGGPASTGGSNWGDPRVDPRDPRELRSVDPRELRDPRDHRMSLDPREQHMRVMDSMGARDMPRMPGEVRGDPRGGISGRLNGSSADAMWNQPPGPPHHQIPSHQHPNGPPNKMIAPSNINQWTAPPPKDMIPGKPTGWEEPSPPTQRRNVPNYDDGTSLWANPAANQRPMQGNKAPHWKDVQTQNFGRGNDYFASGGMQCPPGMMQNQMPGQPGMKPDTSGGQMWGANYPGSGAGPTGGSHNGSWTDGPSDISNWSSGGAIRKRSVRDIVNPQTSGKNFSWDEHKKPPMGPSGAGNWGDSDMDPSSNWAAHTPHKPTLTKELIWNSREFRYLCDMGFKKEDVELALRNREMNCDEAQELLNQLRPTDQWRRHDGGGHSSYDPSSQSAGSQSFSRFNHISQPVAFTPGVGVPSSAVPASGGSVASSSLLKLHQQQQQQQQQQAAAAVQLQQQQQQQPPSSNTPQQSFNQSSRLPSNPPSAQQLRMLVQQIQLAVQEGYLNHQILNQPLAPQTLMLLNQLLQQIKVLQQLHQQHSMQNAIKNNSQNVLQISVQITKTKQQITNLQNQISVQQATYMKQQQQQQQQQHPSTPSQSSDYYKPSIQDPMSALQSSFSDLSMHKEAPVSQQQSRLNQWKLPSLDKDTDSVVNEFSRAPGSSSKPPSTPSSLNSAHSNPLLGPGDATWSSRLGDSGWPDTSNNDATDGKDWQPGGTSAAFADLVPEFEPGKPWKMKSIEDDPNITPGSVVRSPLSLAAIKDTDTIFAPGSKSSSPPQSVNSDNTPIPSLSNSTWSFTPAAATTPVFPSSKNTWGDSAPPPTAVTSELWGAPMNNKSRGPPPGLGSKGGSVSNVSNGWSSSIGRSNTWGLQSNSPGGNGGNPGGWVSPSTWLLLRNLTPQIDGSTLKTLCMQHGPVQDFRLYLNHGIALAKYSSRDEAIKAQGALNNCVLGNTTIFAESPVDSEVHTLLQQLSHGSAGPSPAGPGATQQPPGSVGPNAPSWVGGLRSSGSNKSVGPPSANDTWAAASGASQLWGAPPTGNSLWGSSGLDGGDQQRTTPSSLNSYLPGDLLGGESM
ncbi:protein Gawky isoform X4 [Trichogramma pretiosum]|uniref:protein Gawky isoform X4 n=1 Tax=Trichogramma pretiosum TaxID=7493 RepID=UPI0006C991C1|nr:protein Gawky isoform X4 [Trichogramma pretiosum]